MKSWRMIAAIGGPFLLLFVLLYAILCPLPFFDMQVGYMDILQYKIPDGVNIIDEKFNAFGRDRMIYDYCILLRGTPEALIAYTAVLGLTEKEIPDNPRANQITQVKHKWWNPPLLTRGSGARFYEKQIGNPSLKNGEYSRIQAELVGNELYLLKIGDIQSLKAQMERRAKTSKTK